MGGIKGDIGAQVSEMFEENGFSAPDTTELAVHGAGKAPDRPRHEEALYYERPSHLKGRAAIEEPSANPEGKHAGRVGRASGMVRSHNKAKGNEEVNGTNWRADVLHHARDDRPLDEIFREERDGRGR